MVKLTTRVMKWERGSTRKTIPYFTLSSYFILLCKMVTYRHVSEMQTTAAAIAPLVITQ